MKQAVKGLVAAALSVTAAVAIAQGQSEEVNERLEPVGDVCMAGEACTGGDAAQMAAGESRGPEEIYQSYCASCHDEGVSGAPEMGSAEAWESRVEKGMETLYENAWNGLNAMPPKGICTDCSEEELNATVDYMVEESQ